MSPAKAVRWAEVYSYSPSPATSYSTLPSSPGVLTPPQQLWPLSPIQPQSPLPSAQMHPVLCASSLPAIVYDMSLPPITAAPRDPNLNSQVLLDSATNPPQSSLTLRSKDLPWPVKIKTKNPQGFVTVGDVLSGIHDSLRSLAGKAEWENVRSPEERVLVNEAYKRRFRRLPDHASRASEEAQGLRRIDFCLGKNMFGGLKPTAKGPKEWELRTRS